MEQFTGGPSFICDGCTKGPFKSKAGLVSHQRWCKAVQDSAPAATDEKPQAIRLDTAFSRSTAGEGAQRAKAALVGDPKALQGAMDGDARSVGKIVSRLSQGHVGVPEIGALACETALPPPLKEAEYAALCAVWGDEALDIPPNVLKLLVTASIFGPRLLAHESIGPAIKNGAAKIGRKLGLVEEEPAQLPARPARSAPVAAAAPPAPTNNKPPAKPKQDAPLDPSPAWEQI